MLSLWPLMAIAVLDHSFVNHKSEEMICWQCGYVIWRCDTAAEVASAINDLSGHLRACGKQWHETTPVRYSYKVWLKKQTLP